MPMLYSTCSIRTLLIKDTLPEQIAGPEVSDRSLGLKGSAVHKYLPQTLKNHSLLDVRSVSTSVL